MAELQANLKLENAPYIKNLFYVDKKDNYYLVLALSDTKVEKTFWKQVGVSPGNIRLARDEQIEKILGVSKGVVNPFALQNDKENKVLLNYIGSISFLFKIQVAKLIIDQNLFENHKNFAFHPNTNTETVELSKESFLAFLNHINRKHVVLALDQVVEAPVEKPEKNEKEAIPGKKTIKI